MKRLISAALFLIILCTGLLPLLSGCQQRKDLLEAESVSLKKTSLSDFGISSVRAVDFADGKFVVLSDAGLTVLDPSDPPSASRPVPLPEGTVGMKIRGGFIYLLSENRLSVRSYKNFSLGTAVREYGIPEIPEGFRVFKLDVCETYVLISLRSVRLNDRGQYSIGNMFVCIDLSEGEAQILSDMSDFEFRAGTVREKDVLLLSGASGLNSGNIYPYDGKISLEVCRLTDATDAVNIQYDAERDLVWVLSDGKISYVSLSKNESGVFYHIGPDMVKSAEGSYILNGLFPLKDRLYAVSVDSGMIYELSEAPVGTGEADSDDGHVLNILMLGMQATTFEPMMDAVEELLGTKVRLTVFDSLSEDAKIRLKLLSGDTDFDLYGIVPESLAYYASVNALIDLSGDEVIEENFGNMIDGVKDLCMIGDVLCGVPVKYWFNLEVYSVNEELLGQLGEELPAEPMTWEETLEWGRGLKAKADEAGVEDFFLIDDWKYASMAISYLSNYCNYEKREVEDRREDLRKALTAYYQMADEGLVQTGGSDGIPLYSWRRNEFNHQTPYRLLTAAPLIAEDAKNPIYLSVLAVNPYTPYREAAVGYLRQISSFEFLHTFPMLLVLKDPSLYDYVDPAYGRFELDPDSEAFHRICQIFKNSTRYFINDELDEKLSDLANRIADRTVTVDEYVEEFYRKVSLLVLE